MMPGENGFDLAASLREDSDVPILMLTARSEAVDRVRGLEIGADDYLAKPFDPKELALRVASILRREADGEHLVARGEQHVECGRRDSGRFVPVSVPSELSEALEPFENKRSR